MTPQEIADEYLELMLRDHALCVAKQITPRQLKKELKELRIGTKRLLRKLGLSSKEAEKILNREITFYTNTVLIGAIG